MGVQRPDLVRLAAEVDAHLPRIAAEVEAIYRLARPSDVGEDERLWALAAHLQSFYTGVEAILDRATRAFEGPYPGGPDSHRRLLDASAFDLPGVRPPILASATADALRPYLAFRHFFRHAYGVTLAWEKMREKAMGIRDVHALLVVDLGRFSAFLDALARSG